MPADPSSLADNLTKRYRTLNTTRLKIESLHQDERISKRDKAQFYEGLHLKTHVLFEAFIENLFFGLLLDRSAINRPNSIIPRVNFKSHIIARDVIQGGRNYTDWIPYDNTIKRANLFFRNGLPFSILDNRDKDDIKKSHIIRNAIAHESRHSLGLFTKHFVSNSTPASDRTPSGYLMGVLRISPLQTRYENIATKLLIVANKLSNY